MIEIALAAVGAAIAVGASGLASAVGAGIAGASGIRAVAEDPKKFSMALLFQALPQTQGIYGFLIGILILLGTGIIGNLKEITLAQGLGAVGAGIAIGVAGVSAIGQGIVAASGVAASSENKKNFGKSLLFSALPETQALYGFIIAILILIGVGLMGGTGSNATEAMGWATIGAGLAVGFAGVSAIGQGIASAASLSAVAEKPKAFGKGILFSALPETQALYGFIIAILTLIGFGVLGEARLDLTQTAGIIAIGGGLAVGFAGVSAIGQGIAAASGIAASTRDPKMFGKSIIFSALPETQALYAFLIAILLLIGGGILTTATIGESQGLGLLAIGAGLASGIAAISAIGQGIAASTGINAVGENPKMFGKSLLFSVIPETQALYGFLIAVLLLVGGGIIGQAKDGITLPIGLMAVGAGLAIGLAGVSAIGQGMAASASIGAVSRDNKMFGKSLLFSVIPETQAVYGFLIAILIMVGAGILGVLRTDISLGTGLLTIGAGLSIGLAAVSAIGQGIAASAGVSAVADKPKMFGKGVLFAALPETQALYAFLIAILLLVGGGIMGTAKGDITSGIGLAAIGAGIAVGLAAVSALGQGIAAAAGVAASTEKTKNFGKSLLFSALPETQALYGFLIGILLLAGSGLVGMLNGSFTTPYGLVAIGAGLAVGIAGVSAIGQGMSSASGIGSISEKSDMFGKGIIFSIIPETQALMGFLIGILLLIGTGIMGTLREGITMAMGLVAIGSGLAIGIAAISAVGQGYTITSALGAVTRDSKMFGKALLFSVLPQTQALYGFLIAVLLLVGGGLISQSAFEVNVPMGLVAIGSGLAVGLAAISAMGQGIVAGSGVRSAAENPKNFGKSLLFSALPETQALYGFLIGILLLVGGGLLGAFKPGLTIPIGMVAIGAGIAVGISGISAIGQGIAASASVAAVTDKPKMFGKGILFAALPETQALYGTIVAILLLTGVGLLGVIKEGITDVQGLGAIAMGLTMGIAAVSAVGQGVISASAVGAASRDSASTGKGLVLSAIPETYAIFGLLIAILMMLGFRII
ncbi:MAG: hypothetical protein ABIC95_01555 [archaeon]